MSLPENVSRPAASGRVPARQRASVLFPAPLLPSTARHSPRATLRFTSKRACALPYPAHTEDASSRAPTSAADPCTYTAPFKKSPTRADLQNLPELARLVLQGLEFIGASSSCGYPSRDVYRSGGSMTWLSESMIGVVSKIVGIKRSLRHQRRGSPERFPAPAILDDVSHHTEPAGQTQDPLIQVNRNCSLSWLSRLR